MVNWVGKIMKLFVLIILCGVDCEVNIKKNNKIWIKVEN